MRENDGGVAVNTLESDAVIKAAVGELAQQYKGLSELADDLIVGRSARFVSNFNGQKYGHSRPSLKGLVVIIGAVYLHEDGTFSLWAAHPKINDGFSPDDVELL